MEVLNEFLTLVGHAAECIPIRSTLSVGRTSGRSSNAAGTACLFRPGPSGTERFELPVRGIVPARFMFDKLTEKTMTTEAQILRYRKPLQGKRR
jgi:hypothetical protein